MTRPPHILLGVTGCIAAYKAAELVRLFSGRAWETSVVMTRAATEFVGELTFRTLSRRPVGVELFDERIDWVPEHISLADWADVYLIAPCTANVMAKLAHGLADDLLTCSALATEAPLIVAPAMNAKMWAHAATQHNVQVLSSRGVQLLDVGTGALACGYEGRGRLAEPAEILQAVEEVLNTIQAEKGFQI